MVAIAGNDKPTITGAKAGQAVTNNAAIQPFSGVAITDPDMGVVDSLTIALTGAGGTLSGTGLSATDTADTYSLAAASPSTLTSELDALTFTPTASAPGTSTTTGFTLTVTQTAGGNTVTATDSTTSVIDTVPVQPSTITIPTADQPQTSTGLAIVKPFAGVTIADANQGSPTETVTVTPSSTSIGTLADPNAKTDGSTTSNGTITLRGSASTVTADLDALTFTPAYGQSGTTTFTITDTNSAKLTSTPGTAAVTVNLPALTTAQLKQVGTDLSQFYKDTTAHASTTADASKLASDFTSLDISQTELGSLLGQTLTAATLASTAASTLGSDIATKYYPKLTADLASGNNTGLANDLTSMLLTTAGVGADDLMRVHTGQGANAALTATVADFKLA